ncbi:HAD family hydrolase [Rodentibacter trehalosifermentans]|uniref:HAD family hydrolase n=1 Tax=Rodentibacter trehalosifermentans TaxID=1908263 RepID=A0A1V3IUA3_9PAST|nr:HAD-IA family hydrolase [Rodentibacter trehalosifermentans]OOF45743.1 HAD family hydrolase [Rodentibacter trehalosifermentans]OOF49326.1 HAD family hydrolase [Rodentibacter trehalosifermentans]
MKFYRNLSPFKVISFDLDDTLYDNCEVIRTAVSRFVQFTQELTRCPTFETEWLVWKERVAQENPLLSEDVTEWRKEALRQFLAAQGKSAVEIDRTLSLAINEFLHWRHQIELPPNTPQVLNALRTNYKLAAITNGNVDPWRIGLSQFDLILRGGEHGRAKPHEDLFHKTASYFNVSPQEILHVGDNLTTDVQGAIQAGCQAVWINLSDKSLIDFPQATLLPTLEINHLTELLLL